MFDQSTSGRCPAVGRAKPLRAFPSIIAGVSLAGLIAFASAPAWADAMQEFAQRLATLRGEVETLSSELSAATSEGRDELRSLARQKAELELELKKEETRVAKLAVAVGQKRRAIAADEDRDAELGPLFELNLERVRAYVRQSLPFRTQERLAELTKLKKQLDSGLLSPPRALSRLWTFVEDEFRLARENGLYQQTIVVDGQEQLADVVRVGTVMLFFKTREGEVGHVVRQGETYVFQPSTEPADQKQILTLFDSFRKQIRAGYFRLPNALAAAEQGSSETRPGGADPEPARAPASVPAQEGQP